MISQILKRSRSISCSHPLYELFISNNAKFSTSVQSTSTSTSTTASKGFIAAIKKDQQIREQILKQQQKQKLDVFVDVLLSLNVSELNYLNQLQTKAAIESNKYSVLSSKIFTANGSKCTPLQYVYQRQWIKKNWKDTHLLTNVVIAEGDQDAGKEQEEVVKEIWEIELTAVEASQKIKIIKALREMFGMGLKEAKEIADKTPSIIKRERLNEAQKIKQTLEKQGCVITLK